MTFIPRFLAVVSLSVPVCSISVAGPQARSQGRPEVITFDAPGAGTASGQGTVPRSISSNGEVTGEFYDSHEAVHGFVRTADGTITAVDVPGASTSNAQGTFPRCINPSGEIAGLYNDASHLVTRGFVRNNFGVITTFDGLPMSINSRGQTTGTVSGRHGFIRDTDGTIATFDAGPIGTFPQSINPSGEVAGYYEDFTFIPHGFVRDRDGEITTFNVGPNNPTFPLSINPKGEITGFYSDSASMKFRVLVVPSSVMARFLKASTQAAKSRVSTRMQLVRTTAFCEDLITTRSRVKLMTTNRTRLTRVAFAELLNTN